MADYYIRFTCLLDVGSAQNAARAVAIREQLAAELKAAEDVSLGFDMQEPTRHESDGRLILYSEDYGDIEHLIRFVGRCGKEFNLTGRWGFQWTLGCSKPRLDSFEGGACVLDLASGRVISSTTTTEWLQHELHPQGVAPKEPGGNAPDGSRTA
jgi:hypothetical protein